MSKGEKRLLVVVMETLRRRVTASKNDIRKAGEEWFSEDPEDWTEA